jgi:uncharacterized protein YuzE
MTIDARYDSEADALYVTLREGDRVRAIEIDEVTYVDVDSEGQALGLEFLYPAMGISLDAAVKRFALHHHLHAIASAIARANSPAPVPTMTSATAGGLASTAITMVMIEGTIPATPYSPVECVTQPDRVICA